MKRRPVVPFCDVPPYRLDLVDQQAARALPLQVWTGQEILPERRIARQHLAERLPASPCVLLSRGTCLRPRFANKPAVRVEEEAIISHAALHEKREARVDQRFILVWTVRDK